MAAWGWGRAYMPSYLGFQEPRLGIPVLLQLILHVLAESHGILASVVWAEVFDDGLCFSWSRNRDLIVLNVDGFKNCNAEPRQLSPATQNIAQLYQQPLAAQPVRKPLEMHSAVVITKCRGNLSRKTLGFGCHFSFQEWAKHTPNPLLQEKMLSASPWDLVPQSCGCSRADKVFKETDKCYRLMFSRISQFYHIVRLLKLTQSSYKGYFLDVGTAVSSLF